MNLREQRAACLGQDPFRLRRPLWKEKYLNERLQVGRTGTQEKGKVVE